MFQIPEATEARLATVTNRIERHGDEDKPAVSLGLEITTANTVLDAIDPKLREALFKPKPDDTPELPGVEQSTPVLRCNSIDRVTLPTRHEGWTLSIDAGIDEETALVFGSVKVDKLSVEPKQGGSIVLRLRLGTCDVDAERLGWLGMHNGESIWIRLTAPEKQPDAIDGTGADFAADHPDATDLFAAGAATDDANLQNDLQNCEASARAALAAVRSQFGSREAELQAEAAAGASKRTARGREATKKALAAGLAAHETGTVQ